MPPTAPTRSRYGDASHQGLRKCFRQVLTQGKGCRRHHPVNQPPIPTVEVADRLGRTVRQVHYLIEAGRISPSIQGNGPRGAMFFNADDVDRLAAALADESAEVAS